MRDDAPPTSAWRQGGMRMHSGPTKERDSEAIPQRSQQGRTRRPGQRAHAQSTAFWANGSRHQRWFCAPSFTLGTHYPLPHTIGHFADPIAGRAWFPRPIHRRCPPWTCYLASSNAVLACYHLLPPILDVHGAAKDQHAKNLCDTITPEGGPGCR